MPNIVNEILYRELEKDVKEAGSCLVVSFDKLTVEEDSALRNQFREAGLSYKVVKNRIATRAFKEALDVEMGEAFSGKCGLILAAEENAIAAAKMVREAMKKRPEPPVKVVGGVIEGEAIVGQMAATIADMPDRQTVNTQLAIALSGPARSMASMLNAVGGGLARVIQAKIDKEGGS